MHRTLMGQYSCNVCGKRYSQASGLGRHHRETHEISLCMYCRDFKWGGRPYRLREHLEKRHPDVDVDAALDEATRTRRRTTIGTSHPGN
jgi:hypothetical protein